MNRREFARAILAGTMGALLGARPRQVEAASLDDWSPRCVWGRGWTPSERELVDGLTASNFGVGSMALTVADIRQALADLRKPQGPPPPIVVSRREYEQLLEMVPEGDDGRWRWAGVDVGGE